MGETAFQNLCLSNPEEAAMPVGEVSRSIPRGDANSASLDIVVESLLGSGATQLTLWIEESNDGQNWSIPPFSPDVTVITVPGHYQLTRVPVIAAALLRARAQLEDTGEASCTAVLSASIELDHQ